MSEAQTINENLQLWRLQEFLTLHEASCLAVDVEPSNFIMYEDHKPPVGWKPLYTTLCEDIDNYLMQFGIEKEGDIFNSSNVIIPEGGRSESCKITQSAFIKWLNSKGLKPAFFYPDKKMPIKNKPKEEKQPNENSLDFWRLREHLTIDEATYLALDCDPSNRNYCPNGWDGLNTALLEAADRTQCVFDSIELVFEGSTLSGESLLSVYKLKIWFKSKKILPTFFFPEDTDKLEIITNEKSEYQTRLMPIMYDTIKRYYSENYDPDDRDTVPKQVDVIEWLESTYSLSNPEAKAIDKMTRPDIAKYPNGKK